MAKSSFKVEGLRELELALRKLPKSTQRNVLVRTLKKAAAPMHAAAEDMVPEDQGDLLESLTITTSRPRSEKSRRRKSFTQAKRLGFSTATAGAYAKAMGEGPVEIFVGPGRHPQATQQEFGNEIHPPQPYMRPAFDLNAKGAVTIIKRELKREIEKTARRIASRGLRK